MGRREVDDRSIRLQYMGNRCTICKRSIKAMEKRYLTAKGAFEFNHIDPAQKSKIYAKMIRRVVSSEQFDELDKCNLLCRMCHAVWTNQRFKGKVRINLEFTNGRKINKLIACHGMVERKNEQLIHHVFADNPCHHAPYTYALGNSRPLMCGGFESRKTACQIDAGHPPQEDTEDMGSTGIGF